MARLRPATAHVSPAWRRARAMAALGLSAMAIPALAWADSGAPMALPEPFFQVMISLPAFLLGIGLHEWAHAITADRLGDSTPEEEGRLSLNPLDHLDPIGTLFILGAFVYNWPLFGWGKSVNVRPSAFRRPIVDSMKVALAGPLMNVVIASVALAVLRLLFVLGAQEVLSGLALRNLLQMILMIISLNYSLALFNMIPVPPLDGHWVLMNFLDAQKAYALKSLEPYGCIILLILVRSPIMEAPAELIGTLIRLCLTSTLWSAGILAFALGSAYAFIRSLRRF